MDKTKTSGKTKTSVTDSLYKDKKPTTQPSFFKTKTFYALVGLFLLLLVLSLGLYFYLKKEPTMNTAPLTPPDQLQQEMAQEENQPANAVNDGYVGDVTEEEAQLEMERNRLLSQLPTNDYVFSPTPIQTLARQSTNNVVDDLPDYLIVNDRVVNGQGKYVQLSDPSFLQAIGAATQDVENYIVENRLLEKRTNQNGEPKWYIRTVNSFNDDVFVELQSPEEAAILRTNMRNYGLKKAEERLYNVQWRSQPQEVELTAAQKKDDLSPTERDNLMDMIDTQRANNLELVRENERLREEQIRIKKQVVDLVQRLEDDTRVNTKLRAKSIPSASGWQLMTVVDDRIFLKNKDGELITLSQGDRLPDSDLFISHTDAASGLVMVSPVQ